MRTQHMHLPWNKDMRYTSTLPASNLTKSGESYILSFAVPGKKKSDFNISLNNHVITVSINPPDTQIEHKGYSFQEFDYSKFEKSVRLPQGVNQDTIKATYELGVLTVELPLSAELEQKKVIEIL